MPKDYQPQFTPKEYVHAMKYVPTFTFDPKGWNNCHGDGKSRTQGEYRAQTNGTSTGEYQVRLYIPFNKQVAVGPIVLQPKPDGSRPDDVDILEALKDAVKGMKK